MGLSTAYPHAAGTNHSARRVGEDGGMGVVVGRVAQLHRYPVKSLGGEQPERVTLDRRGVVGDRFWAVHDREGRFGSGKTTRRFRRVDGLLRFRSSLDGGVPVVLAPDGRQAPVDTAEAAELLSDGLGRPLVLRRESDVPHHDESPVHVITTAGVRAVAALLGRPVDPRRFRANVVLDVPGTGFPEDGWIGRTLELGDEVALRLGPPMPRCVMVDLAQADLPRDGRILTALGGRPEPTFGLTAWVLRAGTVRRGDPARLR
jgi:uncharacterized protein